MDKILSWKVHSSVKVVLTADDTWRTGENPRVANPRAANRHILDRERAHIAERLSVAAHDRSAKPGKQVDQEHGKGQ